MLRQTVEGNPDDSKGNPALLGEAQQAWRGSERRHVRQLWTKRSCNPVSLTLL